VRLRPHGGEAQFACARLREHGHQLPRVVVVAVWGTRPGEGEGSGRT
jgi:hypothetical protein